MLQTLSAEGQFKSEELQQLAHAAAQRLGVAAPQPPAQSGWIVWQQLPEVAGCCIGTQIISRKEMHGFGEANLQLEARLM
jgi:hypothetical protein